VVVLQRWEEGLQDSASPQFAALASSLTQAGANLLSVMIDICRAGGYKEMSSILADQ
jgi:hypothetical protein